MCRLLYESWVVDENTGRTAFRDFRRDEATMWALFEEFVTGFYECEQHVYQVNPGGGRRIVWADAYAEDDANRARIPLMTADVILESPERRIILDTKTTGTRWRADAVPAPASCTPTTCTNCSRTCGTATRCARDGPHTKASCCIRRSESR